MTWPEVRNNPVPLTVLARSIQSIEIVLFRYSHDHARNGDHSDMPRLEIAFDLLVGPRRDIPMTWPHLHIGRSGAADLRLVPVGRRVHHGSELTIAPGHRKQ